MTWNRTWVGWAAVAVGVGAIVAAFTASSTRVGGGFAFGFGAFIAFFGVLSALARRRTPDYWGLFLVGFAMFLVPFLGNGYHADPGASWTCWVAGVLAMVLALVGLAGDTRAARDVDEQRGAGQRHQRSAMSFWIARLALVVGLVTVLLGIAAQTTPAGFALVIGLGALTAVFAVWALLSVDPTSDFLALACGGFALFLAPWVGGFTADSAAWTAWVCGATVTVLGVVGYAVGDRLDFTTVVEDDAATRYRERFR